MDYKEFIGESIEDAKEKAMDYFNSNHIEYELLPPKFLSVITGKSSVRIKACKHELSTEHNEHIDKTKCFLENLLLKSKMNVSIDEKHENSRIVFVLKGEDEALFTQDKASLLDAFQHVVLKQSNGRDIGITYELDCCDYKKEREQYIKNYVGKVVRTIRKTGKPYFMKPLSPSERRMVHMSIQNEQGLTSESVGEGFYKKIKIEKDNGKQNKS